MNELQQLHENLVYAKEEYQRSITAVQNKDKEINNLKQELSELNSRIEDIKRDIANTEKNIGITLSVDEFIESKKELEIINKRVSSLNEFIPIMQKELKELSRLGQSDNVSYIENKITEILADNAAKEIAIVSGNKLNELIFTSMSLYGFSFTGRPEDTNDLYLKIGERLCKQLFTTKNESIVLPTIEKSMSQRDRLIENLA